MKRLLPATAALLLLAAAAPAASAPRARTLVQAGGAITAFAQDGRFVAWATADPRARCLGTVRVRDLVRGRTFTLTRPGTPGCRMEARVSRIALAAEGSQARVFWTRYETGNNYYYWLFAASTRSPRERDEGLVTEPTADELSVSLAGAGAFLGYGWAHVAEDLDAGLPYTIVDGGVSRLGPDLRPTTVPGLPPTAIAAAGGGRVAFVPRGDLHAVTSSRPSLRAVDVRTAATLAPVARITAGGSVQAVALSRTTVAVLVPRAIETYAVDGKLIARHPVPAGAARDLAVSGSRIVYRVGRSIRVLGRARPLAVAATTPVGLSANGNRVTWAESPRGHGRIRAITLP